MVAFFLLKGFKFAGTSPVNSAENYSAVATEGYNDGPLSMPRTVVFIRHTRYVFLSFWILGHTRRNLRRLVTNATDRRRGTVAWLMNSTRPDPPGPFSKSDCLYSPLHISPHYFLIPLISPLFSTSTLPLTDHCSQNPPKPYTYHPLLGAAAVGVYLANWIILHLCSSPFPRYVSLHLYLFILHFGWVVSINLVLSRILFPLYAYV